MRRLLPRAAVVLAAALTLLMPPAHADAATRDRAVARDAATAAPYVVTRAKGPARSVVTDSAGRWVATFTDGSRTVALAGPGRRFEEPSAAHAVASTTWVRLLAAPFRGTVDTAWLDRARTDATPDVLAVALQFTVGSPDRLDAAGRLLAADASYGPLQADGTRQEGSDWNDFQQVTATYGTTTDPPESAQARSLDCSGFARMVWGVRGSVPLGLEPDGGVSLPRRAAQQALSAPGVVPVADTGRPLTDFARLQPGDLVFFDAATDDGTAIDHVGIFLGVDEGGHRRFISSRKSADGPTMGDLRGASVLDGTGLYARSFRATRRL